MTEEMRKAMDEESVRCDAIRAAFPGELNEAFALLAVVSGWTLEQAHMEYERRNRLESERRSALNAAFQDKAFVSEATEKGWSLQKAKEQYSRLRREVA